MKTLSNALIANEQFANKENKINEAVLYNLLFIGKITMKEYLKATKA
ncbi:hypothetical protein BH11BAC6_BH11BAC6_10910 [soil metagenome]